MQENECIEGPDNTQRSDLRFCEACGPVCSTELYSYTVFRHELMWGTFVPTFEPLIRSQHCPIHEQMPTKFDFFVKQARGFWLEVHTQLVRHVVN